MIFLKKKYSRLNLSIAIALLFLILITTTLVSSNLSNSLNNFSPIGTWKGERDGNVIIMEYLSDNTCFIEFTISDAQADIESTITGICEIDFTKSPLLLSIRSIQELSFPLFTITKVIDNNSIKIGKFSTKWRLRPLTFRDKDSIILNKI